MTVANGALDVFKCQAIEALDWRIYFIEQGLNKDFKKLPSGHFCGFKRISFSGNLGLHDVNARNYYATTDAFCECYVVIPGAEISVQE